PYTTLCRSRVSVQAMLHAWSSVELDEFVGLSLAPALLDNAVVVLNGVLWRDKPIRKTVPKDQLAAMCLEPAEVRVHGVNHGDQLINAGGVRSRRSREHT